MLLLTSLASYYCQRQKITQYHRECLANCWSISCHRSSHFEESLKPWSDYAVQPQWSYFTTCSCNNLLTASRNMPNSSRNLFLPIPQPLCTPPSFVVWNCCNQHLESSMLPFARPRLWSANTINLFIRSFQASIKGHWETQSASFELNTVGTKYNPYWPKT